MSRGPEPLKGYDAALPVARARGHAMFFRRERGSTADLMVSGSGILAIIAIRFAQRLTGSPAAVAAEFRDAILLLRLHPAGGPVSRELWLYNRYGVLRFFRVEDAGIVEIGADGSVMPAPVAGPAAERESRQREKEPAGAEKTAMPENPDSRKRPEEPVPAVDNTAAPAGAEKPALPEKPDGRKRPEEPVPAADNPAPVPAGSAGEKCPGDPAARDESPGAPEPAADHAGTAASGALPVLLPGPGEGGGGPEGG